MDLKCLCIDIFKYFFIHIMIVQSFLLHLVYSAYKLKKEDTYLFNKTFILRAIANFLIVLLRHSEDGSELRFRLQ